MKSENIVLSLEKIKDLTNPIELLQGKLNIIKNLYNKLKINLQNLVDKSEIVDNNNVKYYYVLDNLITTIFTELSKNSEIDLENWLFFKDLLLSEYIASIKNILKVKTLSEGSLKEVGLALIKNKKVSSLLEKAHFIFSIDINLWQKIVDSLKKNPYFLKTLKQIKQFHQNEIERLLFIELNKIPKNINPKIITEFKKEFRKKKISFNKFILSSKPEFYERKFVTNGIKENSKKKEDKSFKLKKKQETQFKSYDKLFKLSEDDFQRLKRKKSRKKLNSFSKLEKTDQPSPDKKKITDEKGKALKPTKINSNGKEIKEETEADIDPLDIIRKRKRKKEEEYKKLLNKIRNNTNRGSD